MSKTVGNRFCGIKRKPRLTLNFANRLIEAEQELDKNCNTNTINALLSLYTEAIEYYEYQNDPKSQDFQLKLQSMFLNPQVVSVMNLRSPQRVTQTEEAKRIQNKTPDSGARIIENSEKQPKEEKSMDRIVNYQNKRNSEVAKKAVSDFKSQDQDLSNRLASRKKSMLSKSTSLTRDSNVTVVNEGNSILSSIYEEQNEYPEEFYAELELAMNNLYEKKAERIAELTLRYEVQMAPLENGDSLMAKVLEKLKIDLKLELEKVSNEFSQQYKEIVEELRRKYNISSDF